MSRWKLHARRRDWPDTYVWTPKRVRRHAQAMAKHYAARGVSAEQARAAGHYLWHDPTAFALLEHYLAVERAAATGAPPSP